MGEEPQGKGSKPTEGKDSAGPSGTKPEGEKGGGLLLLGLGLLAGAAAVRRRARKKKLQAQNPFVDPSSSIPSGTTPLPQIPWEGSTPTIRPSRRSPFGNLGLGSGSIAGSQAPDANEARSLYDQGVGLGKAGDFRGAARAFNRAMLATDVEVASRSAIALGRLLLTQNDSGGAKKAFQHASELRHPRWGPEADAYLTRLG
jgi:MYXO-CTERM domain-containing protein